MRLSVGFKIGLWLALLGTFATGLMGFYAYTQSREMLITSSQDKLLTATKVLALRFSHSVNAVASDVRFLSTLPALKQLAANRSDPKLSAIYRKQLEDVMQRERAETARLADRVQEVSSLLNCADK